MSLNSFSQYNASNLTLTFDSYDGDYAVYFFDVSLIATSSDSSSSTPAAPTLPPHEHTYSWVTLVEPTASHLGVAVCKCSECNCVCDRKTLNYTEGIVKETKEKINAAIASGKATTINIEAGGYIFVNKDIAELFEKAGNVTLVYNFLYKGVNYELTIPAGFNLTQTLNAEGYAGFMFIAGFKGTSLVEL